MGRAIKIITWIAFVIIMILVSFNLLEGFEYKLQDSTYQKVKTLKDNIVIIGIDDASIEQYGRWPWSRDKITKLIEVVEKGNPAAIGIDILFQGNSDNKQVDVDMANTFKKYDNIFIPEYADFNENSHGKDIVVRNLNQPFEELRKSVTKGDNENIGHINIFMDKDGVVRRVPMYYNYNNKTIESITYKIYRQYCKKNNIQPVEMKDIPLDKWNRMYIDFNSGEKEKESTDTDLTYTMMPFNTVLEGDMFDYENDITPKTYFENKIVLIAPYTKGLQDYYYTPLSKYKQVFGIEIQANIIQNLIEHKFKKVVSEYINVIIFIFIAAFTTIISRKWKPIKMLLIVIGTIIAYITISKYLYNKGYVIYISYPIIWITVQYTVTMVLKYIEKILEVKSITNMFGRYVSPKIVKQLISAGSDSLKLGGIKKYVTLFFVDIRGFTSMSEKIAPEMVVKILNEYFETCVSAIFKFDGTLDKFVGDEIMAVFNAPVDLEDHELAAVKAGIDMRDKGKILRQRIKEEYGVDIQFGIGINSGEVIIGNIGTSFKMDYTCIGDVVNTAARLQGAAQGGQIIISKIVYDKVKEYIKTTDLGEIKVKGKEEAIKIYGVEEVIIQ